MVVVRVEYYWAPEKNLGGFEINKACLLYTSDAADEERLV